MGTFVTLAEVIDQVGKDVVRFIMLTRKNDAGLDFDLAKVVEQSRDNPVFYVQYSHARCCSVLRHAAAMFDAAELAPDSLQLADFGVLTDAAELNLIKTMAAWPRMVEGAAEAHEPHRIAYFLHDLSGAFHALSRVGATAGFAARASSRLSAWACFALVDVGFPPAIAAPHLCSWMLPHAV